MPKTSEAAGSEFWTDDTLTSLLDRCVRDRGDAPAILTAGETIGYRALAERVDALAGGLVALGIGRGDVVALQLPNLPAFLYIVLAASRIGAVTSTIHMPYGPREAAEAIRHAGARLVFAAAAAGDRRPAAELAALRPDLPSLAHVVSVGGPAPEGALAFDDIARPGATLPPPPAARDPYVMLFTSGTSSSPKAVLTDYRRFLANARLNCSEKQMGPGSIMLSAAPYTHLFGLYSFHLTLHGAGATALPSNFTPPGLIEAIRSLRPTHIFAAPAHVAACLEAGTWESEALASVRYCVLSGAKAAPELYRRAQEALENGRIAQLWGMTECQCGMFTRPYDGVEQAAQGCGRPSPGNRARVCDPDDNPLPPGEEGALQIQGASVFDAYHRNDEANAAAFTADGWFRTGDQATIDDSGAVSITGREKDLINRGGVKINPADVEEAIDRHPDIVQSAIVPMPDKVLGERACCFAIARPGSSPALADLIAWLEGEGIARLKWPERLILVDDMPLTPTRKVIKGRLRIPD